MQRPLPWFLLALLAAACAPAPSPGPALGPAGSAAHAQEPPPPDEGQKTAPVWGYRVVARYPHDRRAFTQGLLYHDGRLFESTGQYGLSTVREVELETGRVLRQHRLAPQYFGEGLVLRGGQLIQLTWQEGRAFVYDVRDLRPIFEHRYAGEGWGLADLGERLVLSDGSDTLRFVHPDSFAELGRVKVRDGGRPVTNLNELEWIDGLLYANVWHSERIAVIDVESGLVQRWIDLTGILVLPPDPPIGERQNVLNGIAYDSTGKRLFVTGKNWPYLFHIEPVPPAPR